MDPHLALTLSSGAKPAKAKVEDNVATPTTEELSIRIGRGGSHLGKPPFINPSSAIGPGGLGVKWRMYFVKGSCLCGLTQETLEKPGSCGVIILAYGSYC
ncbi:zinc transporter ZIP11 isoform X1 [Tachysurus ichikawai]